MPGLDSIYMYVSKKTPGKIFCKLCIKTQTFSSIKIYSKISGKFRISWHVEVSTYIYGACHLVTSTGTTILVTYHFCQVIATHLVWSETLRWRLKPPASRLFTQPFIRAQIKENIKTPRHWPLCGEFTGDRLFPRTKGQLRGKCFHLMTSSCWCDRRSCNDLKKMVWHQISCPNDNGFYFYWKYIWNRCF